MDHATAAREPLHRLAVEALRILSLAQQGARAGLDAERPIGAARPRAFAQALERGCRLVRAARRATPASISSTSAQPYAMTSSCSHARCGIGERIAIAAVAVVHQGGHPRPDAQRIALAPRRRTWQHPVGDRLHPRLVAAPGRQHQPGVVERRDPGRLRDRGDLVDQLTRRRRRLPEWTWNAARKLAMPGSRVSAPVSRATRTPRLASACQSSSSQRSWARRHASQSQRTSRRGQSLHLAERAERLPERRHRRLRSPP